MVWILALLGILVLVLLWRVIPSEAPSKVAEPVPERVKTDLTQYQQWCAGLDGILTETCQYSHWCLGFTELDAKELEQFQQYLEDEWDIQTREDLLATLDWLGGEGGQNAEFMECAAFFNRNPQTSRADLEEMCAPGSEPSLGQYDLVRQYYTAAGEKGIMAWDFGRYVFLCRSGYTLGFLDRQEALTLIEEAGLEIRGHFASWADFGENFILGQRFWSCDEPKREKQLERESREAYFNLVTGAGAWAGTPWEWSEAKA